MLTALNAPSEALDPSELTFVSKVREHGFLRTEIPGDAEGPGFSFSTGFWASAGQAELIMFSTRGDIAHEVFWHLFRMAKANAWPPFGTKTDQVFCNLPAYAFPVAKRFYPDYLGWTQWFYGNDEFPCIQIVWPDRVGIFPWEEGFDPSLKDDQSDLTENGWRMSLAM